MPTPATATQSSSNGMGPRTWFWWDPLNLMWSDLGWDNSVETEIHSRSGQTSFTLPHPPLLTLQSVCPSQCSATKTMNSIQIKNNVVHFKRLLSSFCLWCWFLKCINHTHWDLLQGLSHTFWDICLFALQEWSRAYKYRAGFRILS